MPLIGDTMNLREYLFIKRMTIQEFSEIVDYSRVHISGIVNGKLKPSRKLAKRIEKETKGEVTVEELMKNSAVIRENQITEKEPKKKEKQNPKMSPKGWHMERSVFDKGE